MRVLPVLAALLLPSLAGAQGISLQASRSTITEGGRASLDVVVTGDLQSSLALPSNELVDFVQTQQSTSQRISRGHVQAQTTFTYAVLTKKPGTVKVGPIRAMVDGRMRRSNQLELTIVPASQAAATAKTAPDAARDTDWYAIAGVSDERPFVGETFTYDLERGIAVRARDLATGWPTWPPLVQEPGVDVEDTQRQAVQGGRRFTIVEDHVALFSVEPGPVTLRPTNSSMTVLNGRQSFGFGIGFGESQRFSSNPVQLTVRPLPRAGRPDGFSGAVGRFSLRSSLDQDTVDAGSTVTLEVTIRGIGGLRSIELPIDVPEGVKVYDADPEQTSSLKDGRVRSQAIYRKTLVPLKPGDVTIPSVSFSFFDPAKEAYRTVRSKPLTLHVTGEAVVDTALLSRSASLGTNKEQVEVLGSDILPLHPTDRVVGDARVRASSPGILALLILPLLAFSLRFGQATQRRMAGTDAGQERRRRKDARGAAGAAKTAARDGDWSEAEAALRSFLSARLERSGAALSGGEAEAVLIAAGAPQALGEGLAGLLDRVEAARYGGGSTEGLAEALARWVADAEGSWR